jgi:hypothetical protein
MHPLHIPVGVQPPAGTLLYSVLCICRAGHEQIVNRSLPHLGRGQMRQGCAEFVAHAQTNKMKHLSKLASQLPTAHVCTVTLDTLTHLGRIPGLPGTRPFLSQADPSNVARAPAICVGTTKRRPRVVGS